ncbi:MAG TPA: class I SAM-dependent methyltransferase [Candidatus Limnocylindrales bacterium]|nr:class I SAM-dependent methyltransferase [Candidatus Limnocylindrales bacterium]
MIEPPDPATAHALARLYDLDLAEDPGDLDLYLALADRAEGPILELAAGTGRLAVPLAAAGHEVTAVDIDEAMLGRARDRATAAGLAAEAIDFIHSDLLELPAPLAGSARFGLAFIALNSIMLLATRDRQRAALRTLSGQLRRGGIAAVDAWLPDADDLGRFDGRVFHEWIREDPVTGTLVTKTGSAVHDASSGSLVLTAVFDEARQGEAPRRWIRQDRLRLISADELAAFAEDAGLRVEMVAGGYDLTPLGYGAERAVLIAERQ